MVDFCEQKLFGLTRDSIDIGELKRAVYSNKCGAFVSFEGLVRNHNNVRPVMSLSYSAYESMAIKQGHKIVVEAIKRFDIHHAVCVHRIGELNIGDMAIFVGVGSSHRSAAFDACRYILDTVKKDVPIWKKEFYADSEEPLWLSNNG